MAENEAWRPLIDPGTVLMGVGRSRWIILLCTVAGAALGVLVALNTPKIYEAATDLLIDPRELQIVDRELSQSGLSSDAVLALIQNQMRIMSSGNVLTKVVDRLDLEADPEFNGTADTGINLNPLDALRAALSPQGGAPDPGMRRAMTIQNLSRQIAVTRDSSTFVVTIWAKAQDPEKAARIANAMSESFLETSGDFQSETASRATNELTGRLDELRRSVEAAERKVEAFKAENGIVDAQGRLITDDEIVKLNDQLSVARARTAELRARAASAGSLDVEDVVAGVLPEQVNSGAMGQLRSGYAALKQEADRLAVRLGPRHPQRLGADVQLQSARDQIAAELSRINSSVQIELSRAQELERDLAQRLDTLKTRQGELSSERVGLRELERDAASKRAVYEAFLLRSRETGEQENINTANINIISEATPPLQSTGLSRSKIAIIGLILGLVTGLAIALLRGAWQSLRDTTQGRERRRVSRSPAVAPAIAAATPWPKNAEPEQQPVAQAHQPQAPSRAPSAASATFPWNAPQEPRTTPSAQLAPSTPSSQSSTPRPSLASYVAQSSQRPEAAPRPASTGSTPTPIDDIRASLREFRDAVQDLQETRRKTGI